VGRFILQIVGFVVLARLLLPADFGRMDMIMAIVGIASLLGDFGLSLAAISAPSLSLQQRANLFWLNTLLGVALFVVIAVCAPLVGAFYGDPSLAWPTVVVALTFPVNGILAQYRADLTRGLHFGILAIGDVGSAGLGLGSAVILARLGFGTWALISQQLVAAIAMCCLCLIAVRQWPGWPRRREGVRSFISVGATTTLTQAINYVSMNAGPVMIAQAQGATAVGLYNRAFQIFSLPLAQLSAPLSRVALPVLARLRGTPAFDQYVRRALLLLAYPAILALASIAGMAQPLVRVVLGPGWAASAEVLAILALGGVFQALGFVYYWVFLASARMVVLLVCEGVGRVVMLVLTVVAVPYGIVAVAGAYSLGLFLIWLIGTSFGLRRVGLSARPVVATSLRPLLIGFVVYSVCRLAWASPLLSPLSPFLQLVVLSTVVVVTVGLAFVTCPPIRSDLKVLVTTLSRAVRK